MIAEVDENSLALLVEWRMLEMVKCRRGDCLKRFMFFDNILNILKKQYCGQVNTGPEGLA
jgi:hypothetical protein